MYIQDTMDQSYNNESDNEVITNTEENSKSFATEMLPPPLPLKETKTATMKIEETKIMDDKINLSLSKVENKNMVVEETVLLDSKENSKNDEEIINEKGNQYK